MSFRLYVWQRASALVLAPLVLVHLIVIFYATAKGLSAAHILARTKGSVGWGMFYGLFVLAAAVHGAIGVRNVVAEWGPRVVKRDQRMLSVIMGAVGLGLALLGLRAVYAVVIA
jgi:fumarate reductase subunit C